MSLLLFYLIELKEEVLPVSNLKPNVIHENSLQGGPFKTVLLLADHVYKELSIHILQKKYLQLIIQWVTTYPCS